MSIVIAGALFQDDFLSAVDGLDGQPAATAAALAAVCLAFVADATVVVVEPGVDDEVVVELDAVLGVVPLNPPARAMIPTMMAMTKTITVARRTFALRFLCRSISARRAALAAFCRARFSCLGTAGHHIGVSGPGCLGN